MVPALLRRQFCNAEWRAECHADSTRLAAGSQHPRDARSQPDAGTVGADHRGVLMDVLVLGPLEVVAGGERLDLGSQRQRTVLAALALDADRVVRLERLVEALYGEDPPSTARVQVQICVS